VKVNEHEQPTEYGGGEQGLIHTLLLHDMHGEYTGEFDKKPEGDNGYGETDLYWQTSKMQDALHEIFGYKADVAERQAAALMPEFLPKAFLEREGDYIEWVWRVTGCYEYLVAKFNQLYISLNVDYVSGDDDAFDYWPNTMDMLWDFACDLDDINPFGGTIHRGQVWGLAKKVFQGTIRHKTWDNEDKSEIHGRAVADRYALFVSEWGLAYDDTIEGWRSWFNKEEMRGR
jgi:hypothetical protein